MSRNISISFAGVSVSPYHDMQMEIDGWEVHCDAATRTKYETGETAAKETFKSTTYESLNVTASYTTSPILHSYYYDAASASAVGVTSAVSGIQPLNGTQISDSVSIYRRQYQQYYQPATNRGYVYADPQWEPVSVYGQGSRIHDFNVKSNTSYQYIAYPTNNKFTQVYATIPGKTFYGKDGKVSEKEGRISAIWPCWSLIELQEKDNPFSGKRQQTSGEVYTPSPTVRGVYLADTSNIWFFRYDVDTGTVAQNLTRTSIQTLGQYPKYSQGLSNYESGSVSCYLGSEVLPFDPVSDYVERLMAGADQPLSTNEGAHMLREWKTFAYSKNPKLLRDMKGQAWIVQIESPSVTPSNYIYGQPIKISFSWRQVADAKGAIIYAPNTESSSTAQAKPGEIGSRWSIWDPTSSTFKYAGITPTWTGR